MAIERGKRRRGGKPARPPDTAAERLSARPAATAALVLLTVGAYLPAFSAGFIWDDVAFTEAAVVREWSGLWSIWFSPSAIENEGHYLAAGLYELLAGAQTLGVRPRRLPTPSMSSCISSTACFSGAWPDGSPSPARGSSPRRSPFTRCTWSRSSGSSSARTCCRGFSISPPSSRGSASRRRRNGRKALRPGVRAVHAGGCCASPSWSHCPRRCSSRGGGRNGRGDRRDAARLAPFFAAGAAMAAADLSFYDTREPLALGYPAAERLLIAAHALWFYAGKLLWPPV